MADAPDQLARLQAAKREAQEIGSAHRADCERGEAFDRRPHRQQGALQTLPCQQYRYADQQ